MNNKRKSSGIIIIGDEILSGKTLDTNSQFISKELSTRGVDVREINTIEDEIDTIVNKVQLFSKNFDYVFVTGGIGPTHDDKTSESIAKACNQELILNTRAKSLLEKHYKKKGLTKSRLKMAFLPEKAKLINNPVSLAPGFNVENIFVFPGVPKIMEVMFHEFIDSFLERSILPQMQISTILAEGIIGEFIEKKQMENKDVKIGSYPYFKDQSFGVTLILKGTNIKKLEEVCNEIFNYLSEKNGKPIIF